MAPLVDDALISTTLSVIQNARRRALSQSIIGVVDVRDEFTETTDLDTGRSRLSVELSFIGDDFDVQIPRTSS